MPIYEYKCEDCEHQMEAIQKISDDPLKECPACGNPSLKKLVSAAAFRLKGTGWYETDFKSKPKDNAKKDETAAKSDSAKTDDKNRQARIVQNLQRRNQRRLQLTEPITINSWGHYVNT